MTQRSTKWLKHRGKRWQKRLRLQDWDIRYHWVDDLNRNDGAAEVKYRIQHRRASVFILRHGDTNDTACVDAGIVHELLHLLLSPFTSNATTETPAGYAEEQVIGALTELITGFKYLDSSWRKG